MYNQLDAIPEVATTSYLMKINSKGCFVELCDEFLDLIDHKREELLGASIGTLLSESDAHQLGGSIESVANMEVSTLVEQLSLKSRGKKEIHFHFSAYYDKHQNLLIGIGSLVKPKKHRKVQDSGIKNVLNPNESTNKRKGLSELKCKFMEVASHQFRTPLTTINSSAELIEEYVVRGKSIEAHRHIGKIKKEVTQVTQLLEDFSKLCKLDENKTVVNPMSFEFHHAIDPVLEGVRTCLKPGQSLAFDTDKNTLSCYSDFSLIETVCKNLLINASKYSLEGAIIRLKVRALGDMLYLEVRDEGRGIPDEDKNHIFERFYRGANVAESQGSGLGLPIAQHYLNLLGGELFFTSQIDKGTTFYLTIPRTY